MAGERLVSPDRVLHKFKLLHQKVNSMDRRVLAALVEEVKTAKVALRGGGGGGRVMGFETLRSKYKKGPAMPRTILQFLFGSNGFKT